jgi:hypothetical protein
VSRRHRDVFGYEPSKLVPFVPDEEADDRHFRRYKFNLERSVDASGWCRENGIFLEIRNNGHRWTFRYKENTVDWYPSSAKLIINRDWENGYHIYDWIQAREIVFDEKTRIDSLPAKKRVAFPVKKSVKPKKKSKLRVIKRKGIIGFFRPAKKSLFRKPLKINLTAKQISERLKLKINPKPKVKGKIQSIADRMKKVIAQMDDEYAGQKNIALDLKHNISPFIELVVPPETDENKMLDELNAKLIALFAEYGIRQSHYPIEVELNPRTGIIPTRAARIAESEATFAKIRGTDEEREAARQSYQSFLDNHPDNGKTGYWKVEGMRHSAICTASSIAEALDKTKEIVQSWEMPTADFIGTELPEVLEL